MCKNCLFEINLDFKVDLKSRLNFMSCLEIKAVFKMSQNRSLKSRLILTLKSRSHFRSCFKIKVVFRMSQKSPFSNYLVYVILMKQTKSGCLNVHFTSTWITKSVVQKFYNWFRKSSDGFHFPCRNYDQKWWSLEILGLKAGKVLFILGRGNRRNEMKKLKQFNDLKLWLM